MDWLQIVIYTTADGIEPVSGRLYQLGITGVEIEDESDFKEFLENNHQYWDYVDDELIAEKSGESCVKVYVSDNPSGHELLLAVRETIGELKNLDENNEFGRLDISINNMSEEDWADNWKRFFHPIPVGKRILIKPEWEDIKEETDRVIFNVNPGMTFGTGSHFTTQLCIEALENYITKDTAMLDLGCGSGILSIISLLLGAKSATAVDIDPNAVHIAYENAKRNNVNVAVYNVYSGDILTDSELIQKTSIRKYDVIAANIVADVIIALLPTAKSLISENGIFITSGIILDRLDEVKLALEENAFNIIDVSSRNDWASITCNIN